jgi:hypothetical protein
MVVSSSMCPKCWACYADPCVRKELIAKMWADGAYLWEIAEVLDTSAGSIATTMHRMRRMGFDLPYRRQSFPNRRGPQHRFTDQRYLPRKMIV